MLSEVKIVNLDNRNFRITLFYGPNIQPFYKFEHQVLRPEQYRGGADGDYKWVRVPRNYKFRINELRIKADQLFYQRE